MIFVCIAQSYVVLWCAVFIQRKPRNGDKLSSLCFLQPMLQSPLPLLRYRVLRVVAKHGRGVAEAVPSYEFADLQQHEVDFVFIPASDEQPLFGPSILLITPGDPGSDRQPRHLRLLLHLQKVLIVYFICIIEIVCKRVSYSAAA